MEVIMRLLAHVLAIVIGMAIGTATASAAEPQAFLLKQGGEVVTSGTYTVEPGKSYAIYGLKNGCSDTPRTPEEARRAVEGRPGFVAPVGATLTYYVKPGLDRYSRSCSGRVPITLVILNTTISFKSYTFTYYGDTVKLAAAPTTAATRAPAVAHSESTSDLPGTPATPATQPLPSASGTITAKPGEVVSDVYKVRGNCDRTTALRYSQAVDAAFDRGGLELNSKEGSLIDEGVVTEKSDSCGKQLPFRQLGFLVNPKFHEQNPGKSEVKLHFWDKELTIHVLN